MGENKRMEQSNRLGKAFFQDQSCLVLAKSLLGQVLARKVGNEVVKGRIVETESYITGCRMFQNSHGPGSTFVYRIYGMYSCFNISSQESGSCVLVRALEPVQGLHIMRTNRRKSMKSKEKPDHKDKNLCSGPSKLCQALGISKEEDDVDVCEDETIWVEAGDTVEEDKIVVTTRVGVKSNLPYRFYEFGNQNVSVKDKVAEETLRTR